MRGTSCEIFKYHAAGARAPAAVAAGLEFGDDLVAVHRPLVEEREDRRADIAPAGPAPSAPSAEAVPEAQAEELKKLIEGTGGDVAKFCEFARVDKLADISVAKFDAAKDAINRAAAARAKKATEK